MSIKVNELERRLNALKSLEDRLKNIHIQQGYICGLINGIRISRGIISGEDYILERDEVQKPSNNSKLVIEKTDTQGSIKGYAVLTFDEHGALLNLDQI